MPYIAYNGELYDDEEIFVVEKNVQDEFDDDIHESIINAIRYVLQKEIEEYNELAIKPEEELAMFWEKKMKV